jgi:hypothetical protein
MRNKVVKSLQPKTSAGNISRMLTSVDSAKYNVAADAISWQTILKSIRCFCKQYNMISLLKIPQGVDLSKPHHVAKATQIKDAINNWQDLDDKDYFQWQGFLLHHGTEVEIESDNWLDDVLQISIEPTLCSEVDSDQHGIPLHQHGSMTTLHCINKHMVVKNQEARKALETYIKTFDIKEFPGENVPTACLCLKAVAQALGDKCLPTNTMQKVLEGFAKSLTDSFNAF